MAGKSSKLPLRKAKRFRLRMMDKQRKERDVVRDIDAISEVRRTSDETEVNRLLLEGWRIQHLMPNGTRFVYLLVR